MREGSTIHILKILGLALALPTTILSVGFGIFYLTEQNIISQGLGLGILLVVVGYFLFMMVRYALNKK